VMTRVVVMTTNNLRDVSGNSMDSSGNVYN